MQPLAHHKLGVPSKDSHNTISPNIDYQPLKRIFERLAIKIDRLSTARHRQRNLAFSAHNGLPADLYSDGGGSPKELDVFFPAALSLPQVESTMITVTVTARELVKNPKA